MKRLIFAVFGTVIAIGMCGVAWSQDADENPEYEKLKVLEPLIGTYYAEWSEEDGEQDTLMTFAWNSNKRALISTREGRKADTKQELRMKRWQGLQDRYYYFWNAVENRIESVGLNPTGGDCTISVVKPIAKGEYALEFVRSTTTTESRSTVQIVVTDDSLTFKITNRKDADGAPLEDVDFVGKRVNPKTVWKRANDE